VAQCESPGESAASFVADGDVPQLTRATKNTVAIGSEKAGFDM
jgi:hypothetical protein